jgi:HlyD family secretion protein
LKLNTEDIMRIKSTFFRWGLPLLALVCLASAIFFIATGRPKQETVAAIQTPAIAPPGANSGVVAGAGVVQPSSELVAISSPVPGVMKAVLVAVGDQVKTGQILFVVDDREVQADLAARATAVSLSKQNIASAEVDLAEKTAALNLYESIGDKRAMIEDELTKRRFAVKSSVARLAVARATLSQSQAQLEQARVAVNLRTVRAPKDATVLQIKIRTGEFAPATQLTEPLITLGTTSPLHVKIDIDEADIGRVSLGNAATVTPRGLANQSVQARFVRVEPLVVPKRSLTNSASERVDTRVLQVVFQLPDNIAGFFVGQQVDAFVPAVKTPAVGKASGGVK